MLEIGIVVLFLIFSFVIWHSLQNNEAIRLKKEKDWNTSYAYVEPYTNYYTLQSLKDEIAKNLLVYQTVQMVNGTHLKTDYILGLRVNKSSDLDYTYVKIEYNNQVSYLKEFYNSEDDLNYYFVLDKGTLGVSKTYYIKLWIEENENTKSFDYEFLNLADIL